MNGLLGLDNIWPIYNYLKIHMNYLCAAFNTVYAFVVWKTRQYTAYCQFMSSIKETKHIGLEQHEGESIIRYIL